MNHISLESQSDAVKQFFLALPADPAGSMVELNGTPVACVIPPPKPSQGSAASPPWTLAKNHRRCDLIDREMDGVITPQEAIELRQLQAEMLRYQQIVAPWPIEAARQLHQQLLKKAAKAQHDADA